MKKIQKIFTTSAILFLLFFPALGFVRAQTPVNTDYTLLAPLPNTSNCPNGSTQTLVVNSDGTTSGGCQTNLSTYVKGAFNLIVGLAAVLAFVVLTYGGVLYMTSDAITGKSQGKDYITNALWGLLLVIASYVILYTINPNIVGFNLNMAQPATTPMISVPNGSGGTMNIPVASTNLNGYNISAYDAGEPAQAALVQNIYNNSLLQNVSATPDGMNEYISQYFPNSSINGAMVASAASQYNVDPKLIMAFMQTESGFGTTGLGAKTNNPGNVGNITGQTTTQYPNLQSGVNAVASWLNSNRSK